MKSLYFLTCLLYASVATAVEVHLSANEIQSGDSVELTLSDNTPLGNVDLSPLTQNFILGGQQQSQSSRFINGVGTTTYAISVVLFPTKEGLLTIPELTVGSEKTAPTTLTVHPKSKTEEKPDNALQLSAELSNTHPYVGQSIFYTLKLHDNMGVVAGEIIPGNLEQSHLFPMGSDTEQTSWHENQPIRLIERTYRLVPQKSGKQQIAPAIFNGEVIHQPAKQKQPQMLFGLDTSALLGNMIQQTRPIQVLSNPIALTVQQKPTNWNGWWLPSEAVSLSVHYDIPPHPTLDDTLSGELTLMAKDIDANDMPMPKFPTLEQFRLYPEPTERETQIQPDGHILGVVKIRFSLIPIREGAVEIPAVQVPWFNTQTKQTEMATVPAYPLQIAPGSKPQPVLLPPVPIHTQPALPPQNTEHFWWGLAFGILGTILLLGLIYGLVKHRLKQAGKKNKNKPIPDFYPF